MAKEFELYDLRVTVVDEDRRLARKLACEKVALYLPVVAPLDPTLDVEPELMDRIRAEGQMGDWSGAGRSISDGLLDRFALAGDADDIIERTQALFAAGFDRVEFGTPHGVDDVEGIQIPGSEVIPALR